MAAEPAHPEPMLHNGRGHNSERPVYSKKKKKERKKYCEQRDKEQEMRTKKEHRGLVSQGEALGFYCGKMGAIEEF